MSESSLTKGAMSRDSACKGRDIMVAMVSGYCMAMRFGINSPNRIDAKVMPTITTPSAPCRA